MKGSWALLCLLSLLFLSACEPSHRRQVDELNTRAYDAHYRNLDSTQAYANRALLLADDYDAGRAEAVNNLAFVHIMRMDFSKAYDLLEEVRRTTDSQIEQLVADVQLMRLCQRESKNKEFYDHRERAVRRMRRIDEERQGLTSRQEARLLYARSEFALVTSVYYYYVGLEQPSIQAMEDINADELERDTAQYLNYLYNIGAGGIITQGTQADINQKEFDHLLRCMLLARQAGYPFWEANSMQAVSEHLLTPRSREQLIKDNLPAMKFLNPDQMPDTLLAGYLAQKSLEMFQKFGDVYQTAGAYRTLASCYMGINDYHSALICLNRALDANKAIEQAPDLVASIREQLSVAYAAIDDKASSDYNRNLYLDKQEQTRQDRQLEARADQLNRSSRQLNLMIFAVVLAIVVVVVLLFVFDALRRKGDRRNSMDQLLQPLREWQQDNEREIGLLNDRYEEINEAYALNVVHIVNNKKRNLENRAKIFLVNSITPFIDRMLHEVLALEQRTEGADKRNERYEYISELCDKINEYNDVLTQWIRLRQGELSLHIESFPLHQLFETVQKSRMSFLLKGITLDVQPTSAVVKADRILTLFMLNTIADNARKFTPQGGTVSVSAQETDDYVELSIADTGKGMSEEELAHVFSHKVIVDNAQQVSHGFGLMNCKGIIEKYRKISQIFKVCMIAAESTPGKGSRFYFRLPKGIARLLLAMSLLGGSLLPLPTMAVSLQEQYAQRAADYADSAYFSNLNGTYQLTLQYADSVRFYMNRLYRESATDRGDTLVRLGGVSAESPEVRWFHQNIPVDYTIILDMRNESAVAALALHEWSLYRYNNKVYTQLFKETSADRGLSDYCHSMMKSEANKQVAVAILVILLLLILPAYYMLYYRHQLYYRFCVDRVRQMNDILLSEEEPQRKLQLIEPLVTERYPQTLQNVVEQIKQALQESVDVNQAKHTSIELAEDERRRAEYEDDKLHISNSVLDNCLSTLKHETMYYPSRIRQLIDGKDDNLQAIHELVSYYKELYTLLSAQAMRQVDAVKFACKPCELYGAYVMGDEDMLKYLFDILRQRAGGKALEVSVAEKDDYYVCYTVAMPALRLTEQECQELFTPSMEHVPYLLCRQIIRDHSQQTARRGCGIMAQPRAEGGINMIVTLTKATIYGQL